ncbi:MAG: TetR/AcrR family transcriptional regulator [Ilumatobacteraceae bacterium]
MSGPKKSSPDVRRSLMENELLDRAAALFSTRGFRATSLQEIAEAMEVSRPALYYYVDSKDDLLNRLVSGFLDALIANVQAAGSSSAPASEKLATIVDCLVEPMLKEPERFRLLGQQGSDLPAPVAKQADDARRAVTTVLEAVLHDGMKEGVFAHTQPRVAARAVLGMINSVLDWHDPDDPQLSSPGATVKALVVAAVSEPDRERQEATTAVATLDRVQAELDRLRLIIETPERN